MASRRARLSRRRRRSPLRTWAVRGLVVVGGGLGLGALAAVAWFKTSLPPAEMQASLPGLEAPVTVLRDRNGVPHVFAGSRSDAAFALGVVHAQDRLWQMEMMRRAGTGRLAEIVGERALRSDRYLRTLGLYRLAEAQYGRLSARVRGVLDAYAAGVNAWLDQRSGPLPPEFALFRFEPEPWRPADSLVWAKLMATRLAGDWRTERLRARLAGRLSDDQIAELWPPYPGDAPTTVPGLAGLVRGLDLASLATADPRPPGTPAEASNIWIVAGDRTSSGAPVLANDPHLGFAAPILWYLARIVTPTGETVGVTAPGVPLVVLGHNGRIAWGMTTANADTEDLFVERLDADDPGRYLTPDGSAPFTVREEVLGVRGGDDVVLSVRSTRHGPVISDLATGDDREVVGADRVAALSATYLADDDVTPEAVFRVAEARDWDDFVAALGRFHSPTQNFGYADAYGTIGLVTAGRVPVRRSGQGDGPVPGWTGEHDWLGFLPFAAMPRQRDPAAGTIVNANNKVVPASYPWYLGDGWDDGYRAERILALVDEARPHSLDDSAAIQGDSVSLMARDLKPRMLAALPGAERHRAIADRLGRWDGTMARDRAEPLIFVAWLRAFNEAVYADELGPLTPSYLGHRPRFLRTVLEDGEAWCDDVATTPVETCAARLEGALDTALAALGDAYGDDVDAWRWGEAHRARFRHAPLGWLPWVGEALNHAIETDGGFYTVNRGGNRLSSPTAPFAHVHGAGYRAVYDLADLRRSRFMIATGQSGNPLSPHYGDLVEAWRDGGWLDLGASREALEREATGRLVLVPAPPRAGDDRD